MSLGLAQNQPRLSCPEEDTAFGEDDEIVRIPGVLSWEECGKSWISSIYFIRLFIATKITCRGNMHARCWVQFLGLEPGEMVRSKVFGWRPKERRGMDGRGIGMPLMFETM